MLPSISARDVAISAGAAVVVALVLRWLVIGVFVIPSHSMDNTLMAGDHIVVSKLKPYIGGIRRGDIIVFTLPDSLRGSAADESFIKRVVAVGGDSIYINRLGITVNGILQPPPPKSFSAIPLEDGHIDLVVPPKHVYVLGDNRSNSWDSRFWGSLPEENIVGGPLFIYWSSGPNDTTGDDHIRWDRLFSGVE